MADAIPQSVYQTVNFHFSVGFKLPGGSDVDVRFQSVSGLDSTLETETIKEGGVNGYEHTLPVRRKYGPLVLKRGLLKPSDSVLTVWLKASFDGIVVAPIPQVPVILLDEKHQPLMFWLLSNVWPRSWKIGELNAEKGEVLIETLELNYNRLVFNG